MRQMARAIVVHEDQLLLIQRNKQGHQFYTLPGGEIEAEETAAEAAIRELREETTVVASVLQPVYVEASADFGRTQYFVCQYESGKPQLLDTAPEAQNMEANNNYYDPLWVTIDMVKDLDILPSSVATRLQADLVHGSWPTEVISLGEEVS